MTTTPADEPDDAADREATGGRVMTATTLPFLVGGFLGPVGTMSVISIYPELRDTFDASTSAVNWSLSGYLLPMALFMLVSGTIGERYGRRRVTRITFIGYAIASVLCVLAPNLGVFITARVMQGVFNAFITPLLIAGLTEQVDPSRLGRAVGIYAGFQAAGGAAAPFISGVAATVNWRWTYVIIGAVAIGLATRPPSGEPRPAASAPPIRPLLTKRMASLWLSALSAAAGPIGIGVLVGVHLRDGLGVSSATTGVILLAAGVTAIVLSPTSGHLIDSWGPRRAALVSAASVTVLTVPLGLIGAAWGLAVAWIIVAGPVAFVPVNLQHLAAVAVPDNRGGALSSVLSFRFFGHALGPVIWVPLLADDPGWAFAGAGLLGLITMGALAVATRSDPDGVGAPPADVPTPSIAHPTTPTVIRPTTAAPSSPSTNPTEEST
ncbi:MFS transporter [Ilumatobacter coccineus]|uniref:Putative major facilitator superfamily transporter n=1 Tax=Ilumatobacter coccineus (strain NBRC 103263 / KCTC 29153 / YM16-304) TaxID=1313172 RepID=A0A6C7E0A2_ILUCY|nr:MFS transporter [Ilumatobacter coccineus]BAN00490.1 putative major facilitator superfamily transporter [Ilumatobacter coccineus YM16-304]